jgi:hypothetical protein
MSAILSGRNLFTLFILLVFVGALVTASEWPLRASIIVLVLGVCGAGLALAQLIVDLRKPRTEKDTPRPTYETPSIETEDPMLGARATWETWAWLVGLVVMVPIVGLPVALTAFVLLYCRAHGGGWPISLLLTALVAGFIYGVYVQIMHVYWPSSWLGGLLEGIVEI